MCLMQLISEVFMKEYNSSISIVETDDSIYEYDIECLSCKISVNVFIILMCVKYASQN